MRRGQFILIAVVVVLVIGAFVPWREMVIRILLPPPGNLYPPAPPMPAVVAESPDQLLAQYERILMERAPNVLAALQPGLTDAEIDALEAKHQFKLTPDLRSLYRWRNGTPRTANICAFPNHEFVPLDQALANREGLRSQVKAQTSEQQRFYATYAGHRDAWLGLIVDLAGDGYFFDPGRSEAEGSFFFCFAEVGEYVFFPSVRNYLAAAIEGNQSGVFTFGARGTDTSDFGKARELFRRYGAENVR